MKKNKSIGKLVVICMLFLCSCDKRPFANIELHGRVMNSTTNIPLQATIQLWTGTHPGDNGSTKFGDTSTNSDGTFDIKSKAGWNSDNYYLVIITSINGAGTGIIKEYHVNKHQNLDVGDISI
jgi:hypothetical protein